MSLSEEKMEQLEMIARAIFEKEMPGDLDAEAKDLVKMLLEKYKLVNPETVELLNDAIKPYNLAVSEEVPKPHNYNEGYPEREPAWIPAINITEGNSGNWDERSQWVTNRVTYINLRKGFSEYGGIYDPKITICSNHKYRNGIEYIYACVPSGNKNMPFATHLLRFNPEGSLNRVFESIADYPVAINECSNNRYQYLKLEPWREYNKYLSRKQFDIDKGYRYATYGNLDKNAGLAYSVNFSQDLGDKAIISFYNNNENYADLVLQEGNIEFNIIPENNFTVSKEEAFVKITETYNLFNESAQKRPHDIGPMKAAVNCLNDLQNRKKQEDDRKSKI